jgi:hypothetical protein
MLAPAATGALHRLAIAAGRAATALARALPAFGGGPPDPVRATTACRRCAAARGILRHCTPQQLIFAQLAAARLIVGQRDRDTVPPARSPQGRQQRVRLLKPSNPHVSSPAAQDELIRAAIYPDAIVARHSA